MLRVREVVGKEMFRLVISVSREVLGKLKEGRVIDVGGTLNNGKLVSKLVDSTLIEGSEIDRDGKLIEGKPVSRLVEGTDIEGKGRLVSRLVEGSVRLGSETDRSVGAEIEAMLKDRLGNEKLVDGTLSGGIAGPEIEGVGNANEVLGRDNDRSVGKLAETPVGKLKLRLGALIDSRLNETSVGRFKLRLGALNVAELREKSVGRLRLKLGPVIDGMERLADGKAGIGMLVEGTFGKLVGSETVSPVGNETLGVKTVRPDSPSVRLSSSPVVKSVTVTAGGTKVTVTASQISVIRLSISIHRHHRI